MAARKPDCVNITQSIHQSVVMWHLPGDTSASMCMTKAAAIRKPASVTMYIQKNVGKTERIVLMCIRQSAVMPKDMRVSMCIRQNAVMWKLPKEVPAHMSVTFVERKESRARTLYQMKT